MDGLVVDGSAGLEVDVLVKVLSKVGIFEMKEGHLLVEEIAGDRPERRVIDSLFEHYIIIR